MSTSRLNTEQLGRAFASSADAPASRSAERRRRIVILAWCTTVALAISAVIGLSVWQGVQEKKKSRNLDFPLQSVPLDGFISNPSGDLQMIKMNNVLMAGAVASAASLGMCADASAQSSAVQWTTASGGNGHWYALCEEAIPLSRAEIMAAAAAKGAQPIMLATKAEELFVYAQFGFTLLGNSADAGSSAFTWMADPGNTYSNWGTGACSNGPYPNNPTNNERFAYLQSASCPGTQNIATQWDDYQLSESPSSLRILFEWSADCNNDGIVDKGQILSGQLIDANSNGIPDCCEQGVACVAFNYPVQWHVNDGGNDHWYVVDTVLRSWMAARDAATSRGAHLGVITSAAEQAFVATSVYRLTAFADTWLGASRPSCSGTFNWVTDEPFAGAPSGTSFLTDCVGWSGPGNFVEHIIRNSSALGWETESNDANIGNYALYEWEADCNADGIVDYGQILSGQLIDANANGIPDSCEIGPCPGDISGNHSVDGVDLAALLGTWGTNGQGEFDCDIDNDGIVGGPDLTIILGGWGPCPN